MAKNSDTPTYVLSVNIPIKDKAMFDDWQKSCKYEHGDGRWSKMISDHYAKKAVVNELNEIEARLSSFEESVMKKLDIILKIIELE